MVVVELQVIEADLENESHQQAILQLLNDYAQEPVISGKPLPENVQSELIAGLQQHPTTNILLAFKEEQAVGIAICFLGFSTFAAKPLLNIHDLAVKVDCRRQGVGKALLATLESKARQLGCCKLTLEVDEKNHGARRLYESAGFVSTQNVQENGQAFFLKKQL